jgi:hypothetical protein
VNGTKINWGFGWLLLAAVLVLFVDLSALRLPGIPIIGTAPFKTDKPSVLVIEESSDHVNYTAEQRAVVLSTRPESVKATIEAKGGRFHVIDDDMPADKLALAPPWVQEAFKVPHASIPWIVGADSRTGFSAPLTTEGDVLAKVKGLK